MAVRSVMHHADILINSYQFHDAVRHQVALKLKDGVSTIGKDESNVKATVHTDWDWDPNNTFFQDLKIHIGEEINRHYTPAFKGEYTTPLNCKNFWLNVYEKGDYAVSHAHIPYDFSFAYFVECDETHSPLIFSDSGYEVPAVKGTYVAFPSYLKHHVDENSSDKLRVTLSGNYSVQ